ncbi:CACTA en-spm transposon protein [Cucumis melo var. makuwa]|uniref:CACTA en-spm transposon protein n=1 Tax=Cucumis melo var. makuwa TaxID=1194695 RepID=A0A5D3E724_CUCMM|nr:CACTA en-spm transposon protein [Cucumis melo var. makuwa]
MVIDESNASGSGDSNFYNMLDKVLHVQHPMGRSVRLFKCRCRNHETSAVSTLEVGEVNVGREFIKVIKDDLQEFKGDCHRHFTKYSYLEQARANPPHILVGRTKG